MPLSRRIVKTIPGICLISILFCSVGCNHFVYLPKSAKQKYFARPHIQFMMTVVDFRESTGGWPSTVYEFQNQAPKNQKILHDFQYSNIYFKPQGSEKLKVFFDGYKRELYLSPEEGQIDLNRFYGVIHFYKTKGKFVWKVKMR